MCLHETRGWAGSAPVADDTTPLNPEGDIWVVKATLETIGFTTTWDLVRVGTALKSAHFLTARRFLRLSIVEVLVDT